MSVMAYAMFKAYEEAQLRIREVPSTQTVNDAMLEESDVDLDTRVGKLK